MSLDKPPLSEYAWVMAARSTRASALCAHYRSDPNFCKFASGREKLWIEKKGSHRR